jgi:hypothetical protein
MNHYVMIYKAIADGLIYPVEIIISTGLYHTNNQFYLRNNETI